MVASVKIRGSMQFGGRLKWCDIGCCALVLYAMANIDMLLRVSVPS